MNTFRQINHIQVTTSLGIIVLVIIIRMTYTVDAVGTHMVVILQCVEHFQRRVLSIFQIRI